MQRSNSFANPRHRSSAFSTNTKRSKKVAQKLAALISKAAFFDTCPMIEPLISKKIHQSPAGSGLFIRSSVKDFRNSRIDDCTGTHWTRFKRHEQSTVFQAKTSKRSIGFPDCNHFSMLGRILKLFSSVVTAPDDSSARDDHAANRDLACFISRLCFL